MGVVVVAVDDDLKKYIYYPTYVPITQHHHAPSVATKAFVTLVPMHSHLTP